MEIIVILVQEFYYYFFFLNAKFTKSLLMATDGFHSDIIIAKWNCEVLRILIYTRLKINKKQTFAVSSPEARFISKI